MGRSRSLRFYLTVFALVISMPLFFVAIITTYRFADAERGRLEGLAYSANNDIVALVDHEITARVALLQALATSSAARAKDYVQLENNIRELARLRDMHFVLLDGSGKQIVNSKVESGLPLLELGDPELRKVFKSQDDVYISNLFADGMSRKPMLHVAVPVQQGGDTVAILCSVIGFGRMEGLLREGLPVGPFFATILDRNGTIIARSSDLNFLVGESLQKFWLGIKEPQGSVSVPNERGVPIFASWWRSPHSGWVIVATVERAALTEPLKRSLQLLALVAAVLLVLAVIGGAWIGRRLTRAQNELVAAAEAVGEGRIITAPATRLDEADRVGHALANASYSISYQAEELQATNQLLERRVDTRTQELSSKTALLETTLDTMRQGLIVIDAQDRVPICNTQARIMLDLPDALMDGIPTIDDLVRYKEGDGEFTDRSIESDQLLRPKPGNELSVYECECTNGTILQVETVPVRGDRGFVRTYTDVTSERRQARELKTAKEAAEAANRAKDDFLANISHEMRTPLNAMIGYSDLLSSSARATSDIRRYAERIHSAGAILLSLIEDILELGKLQAGVIDVRDEPFALAALVSDAISIVRPSAHERGLALRVRFKVHDGVLFLGDQDRLRQILLNLLNNAIKFTPSGSVELDVRESTGPEGRSRLRFSVTDTGIGISKLEQPSVFERFHQLDPSMDRRFGGAGLGLAITKQLVERLGGRIGLESEIGQGSTFWFEVDLARSEAEAHSDGVPATQALRSAARILVAEDVELNQDLVREYLEAGGHKVDIVADGQQAVEAARGGGYDLILMDLSMPEMDGLTAARVIRESGIVKARTAIVVCTANILPSHITAFREAGVDAYLRKPLRRSELYLTIDRLLRHSAKRHDPAECQDHGDVDTADVDGLIALIGSKRVLAALEKLSLELQRLTLDGPIEPSQYTCLADQAHAVISTAGILNMRSLAERCRDFENACRDAVGVDQAFGRLAPAIAQALVETQSLHARLKDHTT